MYIEIHRYNEMNQKALYFKLNNAFNMDITSEQNVKLSGVYAIYKDNICLYVGQSNNAASRIATHLRGKYKDSTEVFFWDIKDIGFEDYEARKSESKKTILDNCEKWFIASLKPIENIIADMDFSLNDEQKPNVDFECDSSIVITINKEYLTLSDGGRSMIEEKILDGLHEIEFNEQNYHLFNEIHNLCDGTATIASKVEK